MKALTLLLLGVMTTSCASNQLALSANETAMNQYAQDDKMLGQPLPAWAQKQSELIASRLFVTGFAEMSADKSPYFVTNAALMDGETKLLTGAPGDFRIITQNSLNHANIDSSEFFQVQTKMQEVLAVQDIKQHKYTCRKIVRFGETRNRVVRACWYRVSAGVEELTKAYAFTAKRKYGIEKARKFEKLMNQELNKINSERRETNENNRSTSSVLNGTGVRNLPKAHTITNGL